MTRCRSGSILGLLVLLAACGTRALAPAGDDVEVKKSAPGESVREPGGTLEAAGMAARHPDEYAWRLFLFINRQAVPGVAGVADPRMPSVRDYEDDKDVVWETWALASADRTPAGEVYLAKGAKPVPWDKLNRAKAALKVLDHTFTDIRQRLSNLSIEMQRSGKPIPFFSLTEPLLDEIRMNRSTFDTIRDNELYNREGLAAAFQKARAAHDRDHIQFRPAAKLVKARWKAIEDFEKPRHHWRVIDGKAYGLRAFHVITKDLPLWFWCDFIHADLEPNEPADSAHDTTTRGPGAPHGKDGVRTETVGSKWQYYRLKGSQIGFVDARGNPTVLGNMLIESGSAATSSCISCHARAGIGKDGQQLPVPDFTLDLPKPKDFGDPEMVGLQTDFLWSIPMRAHSIKE
jgi:hypothetical protein